MCPPFTTAPQTLPKQTGPILRQFYAVRFITFHDNYVYIFANNFFFLITSESIQPLAATRENKYLIEEPKPARYITNEYHEKLIDRGEKQGDTVTNRN